MKKKTVAMAGASGLIGTYLSGYLKGYDIRKISRNDYLLTDEDFAAKYRETDFVINLSGAPIIRRWTKRNKKEILDSRIMTTRKLGSIMEKNSYRERLYISASAIGIYNDKDVHTEDSDAWGTGFLAEVVRKWENEVRKLESTSTKVCIIRTGVVLTDSGGILGRLLPFFRIGLGGRIGRGSQYFSWIHIKDIARAIAYILEHKPSGIYNLTAPGYCTNREFTKILGNTVKRPAHFIIPKVLFRLLYGQGAAVVTGGQAVVPARLIREGFRFEYPGIDKALEDIVN
jgi:uncharacterized protein (TIGR01777 family)